MNSWAEENVDQDILKSSIFQIEVSLPGVKENHCNSCGTRFGLGGDQCPNCDENMDIVPKSKTIKVDMMKGADLKYDGVENVMDTLPSQYAYWSAIYSEAKLIVGVKERTLKSVRGKVYNDILETSRKAGTKLNVDAIKSIIESDSRVIKADIEFFKSQMVAGKLYHMVEVLRMKADMARSLTSLKKSEITNT